MGLGAGGWRVGTEWGLSRPSHEGRGGEEVWRKGWAGKTVGERSYKTSRSVGSGKVSRCADLLTRRDLALLGTCFPTIFPSLFTGSPLVVTEQCIYYLAS